MKTVCINTAEGGVGLVMVRQNILQPRKSSVSATSISRKAYELPQHSAERSELESEVCDLQDHDDQSTSRRQKRFLTQVQTNDLVTG